MPVFSKSLGKMDYSSPEAIKTIANHIRVMQEELEYRLLVLDSSNISEINIDQTPIISSKSNLIEIINETEESLARIRVDSDRITSEVIDKINGCYSRIEQTATEIHAEVADVDDNVSKLSMRADEISLSVQDANDNISNLSMRADEIELSVENLDKDLRAEISLSAEGIKTWVGTELGGYATTQWTSDTITSTVNGALGSYATTQWTENAINQRVQGVEGQYTSLSQTVDGFTSQINGLSGVCMEMQLTIDGLTITDSQGTTMINGSSIQTGTVDTSALHLSGDLTVYNDGDIGGYMGYAASLQTGGSGMHMECGNGEVAVSNSGARLMYHGNTSSQLSVTSGGASVSAMGDLYHFSSGIFFGEDQQSLGATNYLWGQLYSTNSAISTSDRNAKHDIEELPDSYLQLFDGLKPKRFKLNNGTSDRYHVGFIAQEVEEAMTAAGIDSKEFGGFVKGKDAEDEDIYMLRYEEFIGILAAKIQALEAEVKTWTK